MRAVCRALGALLLFGMMAAIAPDARGGWDRVTIVLLEEDGEVREVTGTKIAYGYYQREFTPNGVKDRLRVERSLVFADRDVRFPDLHHIRFEHQLDGSTGLQVPTTMEITYRNRKDTLVQLERKVSELQGFGNPKPVVLIVTTEDDKVHIDLTPSYDEEARARYRPVLEVRFE